MTPSTSHDVPTHEETLGEPRSAPAESTDGMKRFVRGEGTLGGQVGRASVKYGGHVVLKVLVFGVLLFGGVGGMFLGEKMFPRNDTAQFACAAVLGAVPAGVLWWVGKKLLGKWSSPK